MKKEEIALKQFFKNVYKNLKNKKFTHTFPDFLEITKKEFLNCFCEYKYLTNFGRDINTFLKLNKSKPYECGSVTLDYDLIKYISEEFDKEFFNKSKKKFEIKKKDKKIKPNIDGGGDKKIIKYDKKKIKKLIDKIKKDKLSLKEIDNELKKLNLKTDKEYLSEILILLLESMK